MFILNVEGAINKDGKWLLIKRSEKEEHAGGLLSLIGGKVEKEGASIEILERTLHREIGEEVGIEIDNLRYVTSSSFVTDSGLNVVNIVFVCDYKSGEAFAKCPAEVDEVVWMSTKEIVGHSDIPVYLKGYIELADKFVGGNPAADL
ncbi:DNA mismatch repair protein MutT [Neobacillus piezotolerans]|uniref:DNA mismatch repair protein MutT n=1 Tax=Neobacillus piezotolerans TaxID=2259171 RepID=A0A3D8GTU3_9BACI|nr:NUDIX domain-containing protein [Neobacillus piezotolerans]RDU37890.1 DNA mismatch repair protein MutT [Neobacillus piezotolerans]